MCLETGVEFYGRVPLRISWALFELILGTASANAMTRGRP